MMLRHIVIHSFAAIENTIQVNVDNAFPFIKGKFFKLLGANNASAVDQRVNLIEISDNLFKNSLNLSTITLIHLVKHSIFAKFFACFCTKLRKQIKDNGATATLDNAFGTGTTDTSGSTSNNNILIGKI